MFFVCVLCPTMGKDWVRNPVRNLGFLQVGGNLQGSKDSRHSLSWRKTQHCYYSSGFSVSLANSTDWQPHLIPPSARRSAEPLTPTRYHSDKARLGVCRRRCTEDVGTRLIKGVLLWDKRWSSPMLYIVLYVCCIIWSFKLWQGLATGFIADGSPAKPN